MQWYYQEMKKWINQFIKNTVNNFMYIKYCENLNNKEDFKHIFNTYIYIYIICM